MKRRSNPRIIIIGIGSILRKDDGIGTRVAEYLQKQRIHSYVEIVYADISGLDIIKYFKGNHAIIVDAALMNEKPGTIKIFSPSAMKSIVFDKTYSTHGMKLRETIELAVKMNLAENVTIAGIQPKDTGFGLEMTEEIKEKIPFFAKEIIKVIRRLSSTLVGEG